MALYRLNFQDDGSPVTNVLSGSDFLCQHMTTARSRAIQVSTSTARTVVVSRVTNGDEPIVTLVIRPDGSASPPRQADDCTAGGEHPCFCRNCRASRRAN